MKPCQNNRNSKGLIISNQRYSFFTLLKFHDIFIILSLWWVIFTAPGWTFVLIGPNWFFKKSYIFNKELGFRNLRTLLLFSDALGSLAIGGACIHGIGHCSIFSFGTWFHIKTVFLAFSKMSKKVQVRHFIIFTRLLSMFEF